MNYIARKSSIYVLALTAFSLCTTGHVWGVVLHPDGEPNLLIWTDRPDSNVVGRWRSNGTCVAVSSDCVLTVRHTLGGIGASVEIDDKTYTVAEVWDHNTADLRIIKLKGANLAHFVDIYENTDEKDQEIIMGGYGKGRGSLLETGGVTYGYEWDSGGNSTLRFGTNTIDLTYHATGVYDFNAIVAYFDDLGVPGSTTYESALAGYDSGAGFFIKSGGIWKVAGLCHGVEPHYEEGHFGESKYRLWETWFRERSDPNIPHPDYQVAVRLSHYATWIYDTMPQRLPGELTGDDLVNFADFAVFASYWRNTDCHYPDWCQGCDFEPDGDVDWADLAELAYNWLQGESPP